MKNISKNWAIPLIMSLLIVLLASTGLALANFDDVEGHWAQEVINGWSKAQLISGYEDGTFRPDAEITRAEFVVIVNRSFGFTEVQENLFTDVPLDAWFSTHVDRAVAAGYISGYDDDTFRPHEPISRQEVAVIGSNLQDLSQAPAETLEQFTDADSIAGWSSEAVASVVAEDLMHGYEDGSFRPESPITRAESIAILDRMVDEFPVPEFDAQLTLDQDSYHPDDTITIIVINTGNTTIQLGHPFQVEFYDDGAWGKVDLDLAWIHVMEQLEPGFDFRQELVPLEDFQEEPEPGNYLIVKEVHCIDTEQTKNLGVEFILSVEP